MPKVIIRAISLFSKYRALFPYMEAQARHETNDFKSRVYQIDHNLYGMKFTDGRRGQVAERGLMSPEGNNYARYSSDSASVVDLCKWFDYTGFPVSVASAEQYVTELQARNYYGKTEAAKAIYLAGVKKYMK